MLLTVAKRPCKQTFEQILSYTEALQVEVKSTTQLQARNRLALVLGYELF